MALIAAALAAEGESRVTPVETVERGYASLVERLRSLGASGRAGGIESIPREPFAVPGQAAFTRLDCRGRRGCGRPIPVAQPRESH